MDECAEAAIQVLEAAGVLTPAVLFGTSWGGIVAPRVALRIPDRVQAMVLFNTTAERPTLYSRMSSRLLTVLLSIPIFDRIVDRLLLSLQLTPETRLRQPEIGATIATRFRSWDRAAVIKTVRSVLVDRDGILNELTRVNVPALIVSGKQDTILASVFSHRMVERMPNARQVEVAGAAHLVPLEAPDAANALILDFLKK